jgi:hypothetical protein
MPGRIRRAVEAAMAEVSETANAGEVLAKLILDLAVQLGDNGIEFEVESILGVKIPTTVVRLRLAPQTESEASDEE